MFLLQKVDTPHEFAPFAIINIFRSVVPKCRVSNKNKLTNLK